MTDVYYLAYGSNLHPLRLQARLNCELIARISIPNRQLVFSKRGQDGSGKCTLIPSPCPPQDHSARQQPAVQHSALQLSALQHPVLQQSNISYGALYRIDTEAITLLDQIEGGYSRHPVALQVEGRTLEGFTYLARPSQTELGLLPFDWYLRLVICGARHLGFESAYLQRLRCQNSFPDPHPQASDHYQLAAQLEQENLGVSTLPDGQLSAWIEL